MRPVPTGSIATPEQWFVPRGQKRALDPNDAVPCVRVPRSGGNRDGGRLPRGFCIKRLTDLPMLWSGRWASSLDYRRRLRFEPNSADPSRSFPRAANPPCRHRKALSLCTGLSISGRLLYLGDPGLQHDHQHGATYPQHAAVLGPVRARDHRPKIRDKVTASKRKGIWMGGAVPLGYRVENRALHVDEDEAEFVRSLSASPSWSSCSTRKASPSSW